MDSICTIKATKITDKNFVTKFFNENKQAIWRANLFDQVGPIENYIPLIHILNVAKENDIVEIMINSPGGYVTTGIRIMQAIYNCKALVRTISVGPCMSIAACIWGAGKERIMTEPLGSLMVHMPSSQIGGKTLDIAEECGFTNTYFANLIQNLFKNILTEEEFHEVISCRKDKYFDAVTINNRLKGIAQ